MKNVVIGMMVVLMGVGFVQASEITEINESEYKYLVTEIKIFCKFEKFSEVESNLFSFSYNEILWENPIEDNSSNSGKYVYDFSKKYNEALGIGVQNNVSDVWLKIKKELKVLIPEFESYKQKLEIEFTFSDKKPWKFSVDLMTVPDPTFVVFVDGGSNPLDGSVDYVNTLKWSSADDSNYIKTLRTENFEENKELFLQADEYSAKARKVLINIDKIFMESFPEYKKKKKKYIPELKQAE